MKRAKWNDAFAIGVPEVDAEHRSLYHGAEELRRALAAGAPADRINSIVEEVLTHAAGHFAHEERMMRATAYPSAEWHQRQHQTATRRVVEFAARIRAGEESAPGELLAYLQQWLQDHIAVADRMMGAHLRNWSRMNAAALAS